MRLCAGGMRGGRQQEADGKHQTPPHSCPDLPHEVAPSSSPPTHPSPCPQIGALIPESWGQRKEHMRVEGSSRLNRSQGLDTDTDNKEKASCPNPPVCTTPHANNSLSPTPSLLISQQPCKVTREKHWRGEKWEKDDHPRTSRSSGGDSKMRREGSIYPSLHMRSWRKADNISK